MENIKKNKKGIIKLHYKCNNNCIFCWVEDYRKEKEKLQPQTTKDIFKKVVLAKKLDINTIILSGGEPTIRKDFFEIAQFIKKQGFYLGLGTNARTLSIDSFFNKLLENNLNYVQTSFYSSNEKTYQKITQTKSLNQNVQGIKNCVENKINLVINHVIHNENLNELQKNITFLENLGVKNIKLSVVEPRGNTLLSKQIIPDLISVAKKINNLKTKNIKISTEGIPLCLLNNQKSHCEFHEMGIYYMIEAYEDKWFPVDSKHKKINICKNCDNKFCPGLYFKYFEMFPEIQNKLIPKH